MTILRRFAALLAVVTALLRGECPAPTPPQIVVAPNVRVSADRSRQYHGELWACADPTDAGRLLVASMLFDAARGEDHSIVYASHDGGTTWNATLETGSSSDPACAFAPDHTALFTHLNITAGKLETFRSPDGGSHWTAPTLTEPVDREYVTVDDSRSRYRGTVYLYAHDSRDPAQRGREFALWTSKDGGATFGSRVMPPAGVGAIPGNAAILSDGTFVEVSNVVIPGATGEKTSAGRAVGAFVSHDGGGHVVGPIAVSSQVPPATAGKGGATVTTLPYVAVDKSGGPHRDRLYVVWPDGRSGRSEILLSYSSDKGATWSAPRAVDDVVVASGHSSGPDSSMPAVAVNKDGVIGVSWYDRREAADNRAWRCRFSISVDGGETFLPSVGVSEALYQPQQNHVPAVPPDVIAALRRPSFSQAVFTFTGGDTAGLAVDATGAFHVFWTDTRTQIAQLWSSVVRAAL
jgi:hypothetical protein